MITKEIISKLEMEVKETLDFYDSKKLRKSAKQKSEDISGLLEIIMENYIDGAIAPKVDNKPDIILNGKPVEIKTTNGDSWRGGKFSKRGGYYIFISWVLDNFNNPSFFIAGINLVESNWIISKSKKYYATYYGKKELVRDIDKVTVYQGKITSYMRGNQKCIKITHNNTKLLQLLQ